MMARAILQNSYLFDREEIERAKIQSNFYVSPEKQNSISDKIGLFFNELGKEGERINPLSSLNLGKTYLIAGVLIVTVSAVVAYKVTPKIPMK